MTVYRVRACDPSDLDTLETLERLHRLSFTDGSKIPSVWGHCWLAWFGEEAIGFSAMIPSNQGSRIGYLLRFGVLPAHRGNGLQKRMTAICERKARSLGWRALVTDTNLNPPSANSLIAAGFKTYLPEKPWSFPTATYWRKEL